MILTFTAGMGSKLNGSGEFMQIRIVTGQLNPFLVQHPQNSLQSNRVAYATIPSPLPTKPIFSVVVALIEIRSPEISRIGAIVLRIFSAYGPIFGNSRQMVASIFTTLKFFCLTRENVFCRSILLSISL